MFLHLGMATLYMLNWKHLKMPTLYTGLMTVSLTELCIRCAKNITKMIKNLLVHGNGYPCA